jgi:hypothetical protein
MLQQFNQIVRKVKASLFVLVLLAGTVFLFQPAPAAAHCDSVNGPVVLAAQEALETGDVKLILPYVKAGAEAELTAAFQHAREVRKLGGEAQALADRYFFETAVRLHRAGEGAAYTGLKEETDHGPALAAAEQALETGSLEQVYGLLDQAIVEGVAQKYQAVQAAREHVGQEGTVEANRERVEAELIFEQYVYELYTAALGQNLHAEGGEEAHAQAAGDVESAGVHEHAATVE